MSEVLSWLFTAVVVVLGALMVYYTIGVWRLPTGHRPRTVRRDRLGRLLPAKESPTGENPGSEPSPTNPSALPNDDN